MNMGSVDVVIVVPKSDELSALEQAFGVKLAKSHGALPGGKLYYKIPFRLGTDASVSDITVAIVFMNDQGNSIASTVATQALSALDPSILFLFGTAAGREGTVSIGSVMLSSLIVDAQEWRLEERDSPRTRQHKPAEEILTDAERYVNAMSLQNWRSDLMVLLKNCPQAIQSAYDMEKQQPTVRMGVVASSNYLHRKPELLRALWELDDRICCIDMESGGFGEACKTAIRRQWLVIRGISDYGTSESKKDEYRMIAADAAALFLRMFIKRGLVESHPHWLRVPETEKTELSSSNFYTQFDVVSTVMSGIKEKLGIDLGELDLGPSLSFTDYEAVCINWGADPRKAKEVMSNIREDYFTKKYLNYTYENDLRGLLSNWVAEVRRTFDELSVDLRSSVVLDVGIGNGIEVPYLFADAKKLIGVDVSKDMLREAKRCFPSLETINNAAEELRDIRSALIDVYVSLRTYQSSLFDIHAAIRESQRVLKHKGAIVISVANGFVDIIDGKKKVVRGLLIPGNRRIVDKSTPRRIANQVVERLEQLGFESVDYRSTRTDIYVCGQRP